MAVAGVIAEYNPFHRGHRWQLAEIRRRLGEDTAVIACMSGNFVQRGDFALADKFARTEMALAGGADLVLELPTPWAAAAAERFAQGAVALLAATGVATHLAFGCECGELEPLARTAECLDGPRYKEALRRFSGGKTAFAAARQAAVRSLIGAAGECLSSPNNALAVEYLRALGGTCLEPLALPRVGAGHDSREEAPFPSASAIRAQAVRGGGWRDMLPESSAAILSREMEAGRAPASWRICERAALARLRAMEEEDFRPYDGGNEGLYHRVYAAVRAASGLEEALAMAGTKRYPNARLRRMLLHAYLGVPEAAQGETPLYIRVLGANTRGRTLLGQMRRAAALPVVVKPGHIRRLDKAVQQAFDRESRCTDLYALACPALGRPEGEYRAAPVMLPRPDNHARTETAL